MPKSVVLTLATALGSSLFATAVPVGAQVTHQAQLSLDGARTVGDAAAADARARRVGGAIAIVDTGGHVIYLQRLDGTFPAAATVAIEKARTAATFRRPTRDFENAIKGGRTALLGVGVMTPLQGGVPIVIDGQVVGAIGVSGASSAQEDDDIAAAAAGRVSGAAQTASRD